MASNEGADPAPVAPGDALEALSVGARVALPAESAFLAYGADAIWASSPSGMLWRVDAAKGEITTAIELPDLGLARPAFGEGAVWVAEMVSGRLLRLDPASGTITAQVALESSDRPLAIAFDPGRVWVANQTHNSVTIVDTATNEVVDRIDLRADAPGSADRAPSSMAIVDGVAWIVEHRADAPGSCPA